MMGRGAEGGTHQLVSIQSVYGSKVRPQNLGLDIYGQVLKAVAGRNLSRDDPENFAGGGLPLLAAPLSLRVAASFDSKRKNRAKKTQPRSREAGPASKKRHYVDDSAARDSTAGQFWTQMDDYFRALNSSDIQLLLPTTCPRLSEGGTVSDPCLLIPPLGQHYTEKWAEEDAQQAETPTQQTVTRVKRKLLAASPVSKKCKKLSGVLVTTVISPPPEHEDEEELCHVCNGGDSDESNQILFCDTCNVAVHQDCYGVRLVPEGQWLCSWCIRKASRKAESSTSECMLCPVKGGALKPVVEVDSKGNVVKKGLKFAHLFCSQWVPETYIGNMEAMEPIRNVEGVRDERWRLLCSVCKEKHGACIQCSHGLCATAFHPLCAREAKLYMEVASREDNDDVDLRAYCSKHSTTRLGKVYLGPSEGSDGGTSQLKLTAEQDLGKNPRESDAPASNSLSEGKICVTEKPSAEQASPSSPAMQLQTSDEVKVMGGQPLVGSSHAQMDQTEVPTCTRPAGEVNKGPIVEASTGLEDVQTQERKVTSPGGEGLNIPQPVDQQEQGTEQGNHVVASPSVQSQEASQSSHPDSTNPMKLGVPKIKVALSRKNEVSNKLSISALRLARHMSDATSNESYPAVTAGNGCGEVATVWDEKGSEERRQRGLSGEASTSHSHANSPSDSPPVTAQASTFPSSHKLDEKEGMEPSKGLKIAESNRVSSPCAAENTGTTELGSTVDTEEKPILGSAEKIPKKSLRQTAIRADIGKLSIANGNKSGSWPAPYLLEPTAKRESQAASSIKISINGKNGIVKRKQKLDCPLLPVKVEEAEGYGLNQGLEWNMDTSKPREVDANGGGSGANEVEGKGVSASQMITSPDSEEEVSQTEVINLDSQHIDPLIKPVKDTPQASAHPHIMRRLREYQQNIGVLLCTLADSDNHSENETSATALPCLRAVEEVINQENVVLVEKQWEQLQAAEREGVLKLAPDDEVEGEILVLQDMLLSCAQENRGRCERLISTLIPQVTEERASSQRRAQELAIVHQYLSQAREAKKQGRKERRDKEAQAVLAAATAAAAASPRVGYIKRDASSVFDTDNHPSTPLQETAASHSLGVLPTSLRHSKPPVPKPTKLLIASANVPSLSARSGAQARTTFLKPTTITRLALPRTGSQHIQAEGTSVCDICSSGDSSRVNKFVMCDSCKVTVHQECYGIGRIPLGVWLCQPCVEWQRQSQNLKLLEADVQKSLVPCALCCGRGGALKHSTGGRWVHVFCAQWMPGTFVGKDQSAPIEGLENVMPDRYGLVCSICQRQEGACLTCNFGHCHGAFHPLCARESGLFMSVRVGAGGRLQYRAYCDRHSPLQRAKDEQAEQRQRSGVEEMHALRQIRVEFERVRLICERICRRERLKRDVLQTSKDVYLAQLMYTGHSRMDDLEQPQTSEPSGTNRSNASTLTKATLGLYTSSLPQSFLDTPTNNPYEVDDRDQTTDTKPRDATKEHTKKHKKFKKHGDTKLHREKLMTPIEASMQNMRLPKGYAYVPVDVYVKGTIAAPQSGLLEKQQLLPPTSLSSHLRDA